MSKRFIVGYTAPVWAHVHVDDDGDVEVVEVSVGDETAELDESFGNRGVIVPPMYTAASDADRDHVLEHIDDHDWPAWSFG